MSKNSAKAAPTRTGRGGGTARNMPAARGAAARRWWMIAGGLGVVFAVIALYAVYRSGRHQPDATAGGRGYPHAVGQPAAGALAPGFTLASSRDGQVSLADYRGTSVLLYFQEGLTCQPCWDQIRDLEQNTLALRAAGVDAVVSITTDPVNLITQKVTDQKLTTAVLSDPTMVVSRAYHANQYGMMGEMRDGHSFVLVGPDGLIRWRADYGGAPDYLMFLPTPAMLADLTTERAR